MLLELAGEVKRQPDKWRSALRGRIASLLFEKPSLRTRMTFEVA
ncbi:MAG: ornithine carbamoyltransferase, partial [Bryobacteraceae bacterium]|nr:ornithine carbamoyltransferase [Bryobacteraceae bacterium]